MHASQISKCREIKVWEKKDEADKDVDVAKAYFKEIAKDNETYTANFSGPTNNQGYKSATHVKSHNEDDRDKLCTYLRSMSMVIESSGSDKECIQRISTTNSSMVT